MELFVYDLGSNEQGEQDYLLEATSRTMVDIMSVMLIYRLRHKAEIYRIAPKELSVYFTEELPEGDICPSIQCFPDPRATGFGYRVLARPGSWKLEERSPRRTTFGAGWSGV